jgi:hypothetical protein
MLQKGGFMLEMNGLMFGSLYRNRKESIALEWRNFRLDVLCC